MYLLAFVASLLSCVFPVLFVNIFKKFLNPEEHDTREKNNWGALANMVLLGTVYKLQ